MKKSKIALLCLACFGLGVGGEWLFVSHQLKQRARDRTAKNEAAVKTYQNKEAARRWDMLPMPPEPKFGTPLAIPPFQPLNLGFIQMVNGQVAPDSEIDRQLRDRFLLLAESADDSDLDELSALVRDGRIAMRFGELPPTVLAIFGVLPGNGDYANPQPPFQPMIMINLGFFASVVQPDGLRVLQVVLVHEFQHYRQYLEADEGMKPTFLARPAGTAASRQRPTPTDCAFLWRNEHDAYTRATQKAISWGVRDDLSFRLNDPRAFDQYIFMMSGPNASATIPECLPVWARLAGHPHPEAFE